MDSADGLLIHEVVRLVLDSSAQPEPLAGEAVKSYLAPDSHLGRETP